MSTWNDVVEFGCSLDNSEGDDVLDGETWLDEFLEGRDSWARTWEPWVGWPYKWVDSLLSIVVELELEVTAETDDEELNMDDDWAMAEEISWVKVGLDNKPATMFSTSTEGGAEDEFVAGTLLGAGDGWQEGADMIEKIKVILGQAR